MKPIIVILKFEWVGHTLAFAPMFEEKGLVLTDVWPDIGVYAGEASQEVIETLKKHKSVFSINEDPILPLVDAI